jgi:hypothetical protein
MKLQDAQTPSVFDGLIGLGVGFPIGYCTNLWHDGFNIENKYPTFIRNANLKKRLTALALSVALAVGATATEYGLRSYSDNKAKSTQGIVLRK